MHRLYGEFRQIRQHSSKRLLVGELCAAYIEAPPQYCPGNSGDGDRDDADGLTWDESSTHPGCVVAIEQLCGFDSFYIVSDIDLESIDGGLTDNQGSVPSAQLGTDV